MKVVITLSRKNAWFFLPLLLWILAGGIMLVLFTKEKLFLTINQLYTPYTDVLMTGLTGIYIGSIIGAGCSFIVYSLFELRNPVRGK